VMYRGQIVEQASAKHIFTEPQHQYTRLLMDSALRASPQRS
jgi:ABC-type dipeptide/oligopeptide/nickel transport system ATPase component